MRGILDDESLDGPHEARIFYRPERLAVPLAKRSVTSFIDAVRYECQIWGGAVAPIIPIDPNGTIPVSYCRILGGSNIDGMHGLHPWEFFNITKARLGGSVNRQPYGSQIAVALLEKERESYLPVETVELASDDPWAGIYAACLGLLPETPDSSLLDAGNLIPELKFETVIPVERVQAQGSLQDLMQRLTARDRVSPRRLSMLHLAYGNSGSTAIRSGRIVLPDANFARLDAGPNIVVVCSPGSADDTALLWNLRGAHGDLRLLPIGLPIGEVTTDVILRLARDRGIARNGIAVSSVYVTSMSLSKEQLVDVLGEAGDSNFTIVGHEEILTLGYPGGLAHSEILYWSKGRARFSPLSSEAHRDIFRGHALSDTARMICDVHVPDSPFPSSPDIRTDAPTGHFAGGAYSVSASPNRRTEVRDIEWPTRGLIAKAVAMKRERELRESEPGRAARFLLAGLGSVGELRNLAHAPLLTMLEEMAARQGFGWYKSRLRAAGQRADPMSAVGPTTDELPEKSFNEFKQALGNNDRAAKFWLLWAERANLILKGFRLTCSNCGAKQWIPVEGFSPPVICRGCVEEMTTPFGDRPNVEFRYRISERLRRVYEQDAMGHLLAARYFYGLFSGGRESKLIGIHPGMEVHVSDSPMPVGEADVLLLTREAEFIPVEVKRTSSGLTDREIEKLDKLADSLASPWSAIVITQYGKDAGQEFSSLMKWNPESGYSRIVLSYDKLLDRPIWGLGADPFEWKPITTEEVDERERSFVARLASMGDDGDYSWFSDTMMRIPKMRPIG